MDLPKIRVKAKENIYVGNKVVFKVGEEITDFNVLANLEANIPSAVDSFISESGYWKRVAVADVSGMKKEKIEVKKEVAETVVAEKIKSIEEIKSMRRADVPTLKNTEAQIVAVAKSIGLVLDAKKLTKVQMIKEIEKYVVD